MIRNKHWKGGIHIFRKYAQYCESGVLCKGLGIPYTHNWSLCPAASYVQITGTGGPSSRNGFDLVRLIPSGPILLPRSHQLTRFDMKSEATNIQKYRMPAARSDSEIHGTHNKLDEYHVQSGHGFPSEKQV